MRRLCSAVAAMDREIELVRRCAAERDEDEFVCLMDAFGRGEDEVGVTRSRLLAFARYALFTRSRGLDCSQSDVDLIFAYLNMNNRDKSTVYLTDLKLLLTPATPNLPVDSDFKRDVRQIDPSISDIFCSLLEKELEFLKTMVDACEGLTVADLEALWKEAVAGRFVNCEQ